MRAGKWVTIGLFTLGFGWVLWPVELGEVKANSSGPQGSRTGAPAVGGFIAEPTCMTGCHTGNSLNSSLGSMTITGLPNYYFPGQEVTGTVTISHPNRSRFGFQLTALNETGGRAGTLDAVDRTRTQVINGLSSFGNRRYIQHTFSGIDFSPGSPGTWNFLWRAPETASGPINFYASGNAADRNGSSSGDFIYTISKRLEPLPFGVVSAASFGPSNTLASEMIGSIFSVGLAAGVLTATPGQPLPTQLGGTSVEVQDSTGQVTTAPLFFVADSQVNFLVPSNTASGTATVRVRRENTVVAAGAVNVERFSPGLFAANGDGQGIAAAQIVRATGGQIRYETVVRFNSQTSRFEGEPIDLGSEQDQLFLVLYGTGIRGLSSQSSATV
ncbi:MAG: choice-of-anchor V domain-containing protein, partial [Blastocatellia bacterium]